MIFLNDDKVLEMLPVVQKALEAKIAALELKASEQMPVVAKLIQYPKCTDFKIKNTDQPFHSEPSYWFSYKDIWRNVKELQTTEALTERYNNIIATIDEIDEVQKKIDEQNIPLIENNQLIHRKVTLMMKGLGVPDTFSTTEYSSRSHKPKTITNSAGYKGDLSRNVPTSVSGKINTTTLREYALRVWRQKNDAILQKERDEQRKKQELAAINKMAMLRVKYTPEESESDKQDILDAILEKNKYLRLAHYLRMNRGNWVDGYDYAETGLSGFVVETEVDSEIEKDITHHIDNWGGDGRVFRDCEYNYDVIFGMVEDEQLMKDYNSVCEMFN